MKTILCAHPLHCHNGFVGICRLWTASGGVHGFLGLEPTEGYIYIYIYIFMYILCDSVSYLSIHLTSLFNYLRFLLIQTENLHVLFILVHLCIHV